MCGFLGEFSFKNTITQANRFNKLLSLSKHRGPDVTKTQQGNYYQLGFNRLALLDLSEAGEQPKKSPSGRFHLVYNGEVYNYKELADKFHLENLRSTSDTEVILHLFDAIGIVDTLKELNGMFAIAVVDTKTDKLYLSRDFAGIKPLFYGKNNEGIVFASQFDQIFKHPWFSDQLQIREEIASEYFAFGYMQAPNTIYDTIYQVKPGECLMFDNKKNQTKFEILQFSKTFKGEKNRHYHKLRDKLTKAVKLQLNADRSLASFLSGGIDSSLISAVAKSQKKDIEAFTIEVEDKNLNEAEFAKTYAEYLKLEHQVIKITPNDLILEVDNHFLSFSEPFGDYSSLPTYIVTREAVNFHTAMLSGDGGDELFFGYPRMYDLLRKKNWFKMPLPLRKNLVRITNKLRITNTYAPFADSLEQFWMEKHTKLPKALVKKSFGRVKFSREMNALYHIGKQTGAKELQHFLRWNEFYAHLQRVLIKVDRTSMRNSLEVRVPFLDKEVIQEAWGSMHDISDLKKLKQPLKEFVYTYIPKELMMQSKKGFTIPMKDWLRSSLKKDLVYTVCEMPFYGSEHFNTKPLVDYVKDFLDDKHQNEWGVWHIYAWQKWAINQKLVRND
jgi:asparagine synthase (glutamine-hydrolysing)